MYILGDLRLQGDLQTMFEERVTGAILPIITGSILTTDAPRVPVENGQDPDQRPQEIYF